MLSGRVGESTFGAERYLNQEFYRSREWKRIRREVILRDNGCDLADPDHPIYDYVIVHHMNPITSEDIATVSKYLVDPEYLVCISDTTHRAITYGSLSLLPRDYEERYPNDTCPWKRIGGGTSGFDN